MAEEKKVYSVIGKVEIGTDEYRDLIEGLAEANRKADKYNCDYWEQYKKANEAEKRLKEISAKYEELMDFIKSDEAVRTKLQLYRLTKNNNDEEF